MIRPYDDIEGITRRIIRCGIEVHRVLGAGLLEGVYHECMIDELRSQALLVETKKPVPITYKGKRMGSSLFIDVLVEGCVVVEIKAVDCLHPVHSAQVITYLKLTGCPAGLLMNFNQVLLKNGLRRLDHPDRYARSKKD